jgi:probable rRNA maturation factor
MSASPLKQSVGTSAIEIDLVRESPLWDAERDIDATLHSAIAAASADFSLGEAELAIVLTDDERIQVLNREWRGFDKPTNVLSFPVNEPGLGQPTPLLLGDIVIAYETTKREALEQGTPFLHHLLHLTVHGFLHLRGYDHEADDEAETMEQLERQILARLDIPDPYAARDAD